MSKELTRAWKAGKLKALRFYYVLYKNGHIGKANLIQTPDYYGFWNNCDLNDLIKEVLALVPDYDHFVELTEKLLKEGDAAIGKNKQFSDLLKECKDAYQIYIPLFKMLKNEEAVKTAVNLTNKIGEVIDE